MKSDFVIIDIKKPLATRIGVSLIYTLYVGFVIYLIQQKLMVENENVTAIIILAIILFYMLFMVTLPFIARHSIHFNFTEFKIKHEYDIGFYSYKEKWQDLNELEYISIFKVNNLFQLNMWYETNNILNLCVLKDYDQAIKTGFKISEALNIDLLDATVKGNHRWIDKETFKKTGKIVYQD